MPGMSLNMKCRRRIIFYPIVLIEDEFTKNTGLIISVTGHYLMKLFDEINYLNTFIHITSVVNDVIFNCIYKCNLLQEDRTWF